MFSSSMKLSAILLRFSKERTSQQREVNIYWMGKSVAQKAGLSPRYWPLLLQKPCRIIDCTMVFSRHLCAFGFILFCVAIGVPYIVRTMSYSERNIFAIKERRVHVCFGKVPQIKSCSCKIQILLTPPLVILDQAFLILCQSLSPPVL